MFSRPQGTSKASHDLEPGEIRFFDNMIPALLDGEYKITVTHELVSSNIVAPIPGDPFEKQQRFAVEGPRFRIDPTDIHAVYPPANSQADYGQTLPSITLCRKWLPWERALCLEDKKPCATPTDPAYQLPWVALLVFDEEEILFDPPADGAQSPTRSVTRKVREVANQNGQGVLGPALDDVHEDDAVLETLCRTIDVSTAVFAAIAPRRDELAYLAHCRDVDTGQQAILGLKGQGQYAVVTANRFPDTATCEGVRQIVHLVSLEGFSSHLVETPDFGEGIEAVRLVSLASWAFESRARDLSFKGLVENLNNGYTDSPLLQLPVPAGAENAAAHAFNRGYLALDTTTRQGEETVSWYRGPFLPINVRRDLKPPYRTADQAKIYDPSTGMFDISYAVAWQVGRLLALSDRTFASGLLAWKRSGGSLLALLQDRIDLFDRFRRTVPPPESLRAAIGSSPMTRRVEQHLMETVAPLVSGRVAEAADSMLGLRGDPSGLAAHRESMPGLLRPEEVRRCLDRGTDLHGEIYRVIYGEGRD